MAAQPKKSPPARPSAPRGKRSEFTWQLRGILAGVAILGAIIYSLLLHWRGTGWIAANASSIQISAAVSWVLFGGLLLAVTRGMPTIFAWVDACLMTMTVGMGVLMVAPLGVLLVGDSFGTEAHLGVLILANLAMAGVFIARASRLKLDFLRAAGLWFGVMNGVFGLILLLLTLLP